MPDPTSRMLVPAIAAALQGIKTSAEILVAINDRREDPTAVRALVLEALTLLEQMQISLGLDAPFPDEFRSSSNQVRPRAGRRGEGQV